MTLGFTQYFPSGEKTYFQEKIKACEESVSVCTEMKFDRGILPVMIYTTMKPKRHTMRIGNRFKSGMKLHMVYGNRTKNRTQFALMTCTSTQTVVIRYRRTAAVNRHEGVENINYTAMVGNQFLQVFIDGNLIGGRTLARLAVNDGFKNTTEFLKWFRKSGKFQLIHWTNLRY